MIHPSPPPRVALTGQTPNSFFKPPYVGGGGRVGLDLARVSEAALAFHVNLAWKPVAPKRPVAAASPEVVGPTPLRTRRRPDTARGPCRLRNRKPVETGLAAKVGWIEQPAFSRLSCS